MGGNKPEYPNGRKFPTEAIKVERERASGEKVREMAKRPLKRGVITRGKGRRG